MSKEKEKRLFTFTEVMVYLGIKNERTLNKFIDEYKIPTVELLSRKMIDKEDLDGFINAQKKSTTVVASA